MIRALNPLFPGFSLRHLSSGTDNRLLQGLSALSDQSSVNGRDGAEWDAPNHWIEEDRQF